MIDYVFCDWVYELFGKVVYLCVVCRFVFFFFKCWVCVVLYLYFGGGCGVSDG